MTVNSDDAQKQSQVQVAMTMLTKSIGRLRAAWTPLEQRLTAWVVTDQKPVPSNSSGPVEEVEDLVPLADHIRLAACEIDLLSEKIIAVSIGLEL